MKSAVIIQLPKGVAPETILDLIQDEYTSYDGCIDRQGVNSTNRVKVYDGYGCFAVPEGGDYPLNHPGRVHREAKKECRVPQYPPRSY